MPLRLRLPPPPRPTAILTASLPNKLQPPRRFHLRAALLGLCAAPLFLGACTMTPEDRAFYGRGWLNPDELDREPTPPKSFQDPTAVPNHMMGPGYY